ncbi:MULTISPECIES: TolC family protein [Deefgea]|uniref:TolC family protein n=1 Tax=Deefgea chitinilytica TaxID=570276 RepID=A0ABS2C7N6_9NEIS|nr:MULTISPECIES: TolC family protein [Deefgea]MBM5570159.1 hypothetical protein [Deefgea chitinilytica]MBM9887388.1 TolC family protein [Deefgea sp. CFH1-16]
MPSYSLFEKFFLLCLFCVCYSAMAAEIGPKEAFQAALNFEPNYQAAVHQYQAEQKGVGIARAGLLPSINLVANIDSDRDTQSSHRNGRSTETLVKYERQYYQATLRQPLINLPAWYNYQQEIERADSASQSLQANKNQLLLDVVRAYVVSIYEDENISLSKALIKTLEAQQLSAERQLAAGVGTVTDVYSAQSKKDIAEVDLLEAINRKETSLRKLKLLSGLNFVGLKKIKRFDSALLPVLPLDELKSRASLNNPNLALKKSEFEQTEYELKKSRANFLPKLDFVALRENYNRYFNSFDDGSQTNRLGIELSFPLFSGGRDFYRERQVAELREKSKYDFQAATSDLNNELENQYFLYANAERKIKALRLALQSSEHYAFASKKSYEAGVRTLIDSLDADRQLYQARRDLAQSYLQYVLSWLQIGLLTGAVDDSQINMLDALFG